MPEVSSPGIPVEPVPSQTLPATLTLVIASTSPPSRDSLASLLSNAKLFAITLVWIVIAVLLIWYTATGAIGRFVEAINVSQIEAFGVKVNVDSRKSELLRQLKADEAKKGNGDDDFIVTVPKVQQALERAEINAGAIRGARLLWVDDEPENNTTVVDLLSQIGISVVAVTSNVDALARLEAAEVRGQAFDAIVTDGSRPEDKSAKPPLKVMRRCKPVYMAEDVSSEDVGYSYGLSAEAAAARNQRVSAGYVVGGFRLAEEIAGAPALGRYTAIAAPRLIMYSSSNGDISYSPCFRTITRDTANLFQSLVSILEEGRPPVAITAPHNKGSDE